MRGRRRRVGDPAVAVGIVRVSKEEQALSPEAQRAAMARWCEDNGATLAAVHEDHLGSVTPIAKRPGLQAALDDLRDRGAGVLLVARRDRLSRDVLLTGVIERLVEDAGAVVRSAAGEGNGDSPESQFVRGMFDLFAQYERERIRQRTREALAVKRARGERSGTVPWGYRVSADGVHLEASVGEQAVIRQAQEARAGGLSLRGVVVELGRRGVAGRRGRPLGVTQVRDLLLRSQDGIAGR